MNSYNICAKKKKKKKHGKNPKIKEHCALESLALWLISNLCLSSKWCIRHITKDHTLNAALDVIKKYKIGKSDWRRKDRQLNLDSQVITLHFVSGSRIMKGGRELLVIKHPLCTGRCLCQKQYCIPK